MSSPRTNLAERCRNWCIQFEWKPQDLWIGAFWKREGNCVDLWICFLPCVPLHVSWWWSDPEQNLILPMKTLDTTSQADAQKKVSDIKVVGNTDAFRLLCKASSEAQGWMKSTKAMEVHGGCIVQVSTQQKGLDGTYAVAEALVFVPDVFVVPDENGGHRLAATK